MRVLVIGGTGYLGHHVANQLAQEGHVVAVTARNTNRLKEAPANSRYRTVIHDLTDLETWLPDELRKVDAVIYSAGATFKLGYPSPKYHSVNVHFTERFFEIVKKFPHIKTVYVSSMSTLTGTKSPKIQHLPCILQSEDKRGLYDATKIAAEAIVRDYAQKGCDVVIVNPGLMWGPRLDGLEDFSSAAFILNFIKGKLPVFVESGHSFCDVRDAARGVVLALLKGQKGQQYVLGGHNMTLSGFFNRLCNLTGQSLPIQLPSWMLLPISYMLQMVSYATGQSFKNPVPPDTVNSACLFYFANSVRSVHELGYEIRPFVETVRDLVAYCGQHNFFKKKVILNEAAYSETPGPLSLLHQSMRQHYRSAFLQKNQEGLERIFLTNHALSDYLQIVHICSYYKAKSHQFSISPLVKRDLRHINQFFEYLYFSSNDVLNALLQDRLHEH